MASHSYFHFLLKKQVNLFRKDIASKHLRILRETLSRFYQKTKTPFQAPVDLIKKEQIDL